MKATYSITLISLLLAGLTSPAQADDTVINVSPAEAAVLQAASNAVQATAWVQLTNLALQPAPAVGSSVAITGLSTNGMQAATRLILQSQPLSAATPSLAVGQTGGGMMLLEGGSGCVWPGSGLVSWWRAEGDATDSLGLNPGVLVNGASCDSGIVGQAFLLNGTSQSVQVPYSTNLATPSFTFECWVYPTGQIGWQAFVFGQGYGRQLVVQAGQVGLRVACYITDQYGGFHGISTLGEIPVGAWSHLAASYDGTHLNLYTNGVLGAQGAPGLSVIGDSTCPFSIGGVNNSCGYSGQYFPGLVDEVSVYDRALFPGEVNAIYQADWAGKCTTAPSCTTCPGSVVSWWAGEGDASDTVADNNPGTLQNGVTFANGMTGQAFGFDGVNQAVEVPYSVTLTNNAFSVEVWVNPAAQIAGQAVIFGQSYGRQLVVRPGNRGLNVAWVISNNPWTFYEVDSSAEIPIGQWTHLVGTYDGAALRLYVNGGLDKDAPLSTVAWDSACAFHIGGVYDPTGDCPYVGQFFNGQIDEVTYYGQALSAADVQALYNAGTAGKCPAQFIPASWLLHYFGPNYQNEPYAAPDADADGDGYDNLQEYLRGADPNKIRFSVLFDTLRVSNNTATATLTLLGGVAIEMALLVDSTNFATATWTDYSPTVPVNVGSVEGPHEVWIGLRGWATDSVETWAGFPLTRDTSPPPVFITNPAGTNVSRPVLQLQGYSTEPLASIRYDLTNECGLVTNLEGYVTHQWFDTNTVEFTTNWFECLDIPLTNGDNTITLYATDRAGNLSTNVYTYVLDYSGVTDPPALLLYWPQDGARVSGTAFTLRGLLDDPTAAVTAQITDASNVTSQVEGLVERNGLLWVEDLPLGPGTNTLSLMMSNAAGLSSSTNLSVIQSDVVLTIADLSGADLNHPPIPVSGSISADGYTVWVNGVQVTTVWANGDGTWGWQAEGVPVNDGGTAVIQARAIPNTDNGGQGTGGGGGTSSTMADPGNPASAEARDVEADPEKRPEVVQVHYDIGRADLEDWVVPEGGFGKTLQVIGYDLGQPGHASYSDCHGVPSDEEYSWWSVTWDSHGPEAAWGPHGGGRGPDICGLFEPSGFGQQSVRLGSEFCRVYCSRPEWSGVGIPGVRTRARTAHAQYELRTGGKGVWRRRNLFVGTAPVRGVGNYFYPEVDQDPELSGSYDVAPENIVLGDLGRLGSDGRAYKVLPDNSTYDITPVVEGNPYYRYYAPTAARHHLRILANGCNCEAEYPPNTPKFIVGQFIAFESSWEVGAYSSGAPPDIALQTNKWRFYGRFYNDGTNTVPGLSWPTCSTNYFVNNDKLTNDPTTVWWVSGRSEPPASYPVELVQGLMFSNGQRVVLDAYGGIQMCRPEATISPATTAVGVYGNWLLFGDPVTGRAGITFSNTITIPSGFSGSREWVQVVSSTSTVAEEPDSTTHVRTQNGAAPYGDTPIPWSTFDPSGTNPEDSPGLEMDSRYVRCAVSDYFQMWMMFRPNGGEWVPLRTVSWYWSGSATNGPSGWALESSPGDHSVNPPVTDTEDYPVWRSDIADAQWVPPLP